MRLTPIQLVSRLYGLVFLLVGVLGFVPGITQHIYPLAWAGHHGNDLLLGIFMVSVLHNVVHILFGIWGVSASRRGLDTSRFFLVGGGFVYLILWLYGLVIGHGSDFVPVNGADNWLHLFLGLTMVLFGMILGREAIGAHRRNYGVDTDRSV